jgi:hypothetical protein
MASQAEIQAGIDEIVTGAQYPAIKMRPLLTSMLDFSSAGQTLVYPDLVANNTTMEDTTLVLNYGVNIIGTVTPTNFACRLPVPTTGKRVSVVNKSLMALTLFPDYNLGPDGYLIGRIANNPIGVPVSIPPDGNVYDFICIDNPLPGAWVWSAPAIGQWDSGEIAYNSTSSTKWLQSNGVSQIEKSGLSTTGVGGNNSRNVIYTSNANGCTFIPSNMWNVITKIKVYTNISSDLGLGVDSPQVALFGGLGLNNYTAGTNTFVNNVSINTGSYVDPVSANVDNVIAGTVPAPGVTANVGDEGTLWTEFPWSAANVLGYSHVGNKFVSTDGVNDLWAGVFISINFKANQILSGIKFRFFIEYM